MYFSQFKLPRRKYVSIYLDSESKEKMKIWCLMNGFDVSKTYSGNPVDCHDFHVTIFYTESEHTTPNSNIICQKFPIEFEGFDLFGEKRNVPVLKVKKTFDLRNIRRFFENKKYVDSYPVWNPHVTLSYDYNFEVDMSNLTLPKFQVFADKLIIEDIDE